MGWLGTRPQMEILCNALQNAFSEANPLRRSPNRLISAIQNYRRANGLPLLVEGTDSYRQVINRILDRKIPANPMFISALWDFLVYEKAIVDIEAGDDLSQLGHRLHDFFLETGRKFSGPDGLCGWYYGYKPAARNPDQIILKYLVQIKPFSLFPNMFIINEFQFNRSFKSPNSEVIREDWTGIMLARSSNTMFAVIREIINGTPKNITLHSPQPGNDGLMSQILGDFLEIIEKWGHHTTLSKPMMLERIYDPDIYSMPDEAIVEKLGLECDLFDWRIIFSKRYDIVSQVLPNIVIPASESKQVDQGA